MEHIIYWIGGILFTIISMLVPFIFKFLWNRVSQLEKDNRENEISNAVILEKLSHIEKGIENINRRLNTLPCEDICNLERIEKWQGKREGKRNLVVE